MTDHPQSRAGDRLRSIADDFLALRRTVENSKPIAGVPAFDELASQYATAQGITNTALTYLLTASTHPLAYGSAAGHSAIEYLGHTVRLGTDATAQLASAISVAAEYHRIDAQPDPATGRTRPRPSRRRDALDAHLKIATSLLGEGYVRAADAAEFLDKAEARARHEAEKHHADPTLATPEDPRQAAALSPASPVRALSSAQRGALRMIQRGYARLHQNPDGKHRIETGTSTRITMATFESLRGKGLIKAEDGGRLLYSGRRLLLTGAGEQALHTLDSSAPALAQPRPQAALTTTPTAAVKRGVSR
ncbi:hypothetical protein ACFYN0_01390 [Streptomyces sp. NPDC006704]|uniref:hypothetical protein n=1 Tax=Streptomyces sp. NPDC006704 TaxID=3364760 RepID=UPI0036A4CF06